MPADILGDAGGTAWRALPIDGHTAWQRDLGDGVTAAVTLAVWDDQGAGRWEWEVLDRAVDRHIAGGHAETACAALYAVMAHVQHSIMDDI